MLCKHVKIKIMASTLFRGSGGAIYMWKVLARAGVHIILARIVEYISNSNCPIKKPYLYHVTMWVLTAFHSIPRVLRVPWNIISISWKHACALRVAMKYKIFSKARVGSTNLKITKMARYAKEINVVDESDEEIHRVLQQMDVQNRRKWTKFAIQAFRPSEICKQLKKGCKILIKDWKGFLLYFAWIF